MKRFLLYIAVVLAAALFSCSQFYEDLLVKEDSEQSNNVQPGGISATVDFSQCANASDVQSIAVSLSQSDGTNVGEETKIPSSSEFSYEKDGLSVGNYELKFTFYSADKTSLGQSHFPFEIKSGITTDFKITLSALDAAKSITYVMNRTTGDSEIVLYNAIASLKSDAAKADRMFVGWYRESNYSGTAFTDSDIADFADSKTLFAHWGGAALDISVPVGDGAGKTFKSAYLHIPGVAIPDFDDDGFDILSGESAVINNHASIDLSGKKFVDGAETALSGYTAGASGNMTLRVQMGAVNALNGRRTNTSPCD